MMDIPMMDSYLESVAGYVRDEDKLVTYKWLSKELEVHVNVSKLILWRYWQRHKNNDKLVATFMLIGNLKEGGMRVEVVKDADLAEANQKFSKIISEHIYSLQKTLPHIELLAGSGKGDSRYSAIACDKSLMLSDEELLSMRWGKGINPPAVSTEKKPPAVSAEKKNHPTIQQSKKEPFKIKETPEKSASRNDDEKAEEKPVKKISPPSKQKNEKKGAISKKPIPSTKAGFGNLFGKSGNQPKNSVASSSSATNGPRKSSSGSSPERNIAKPGPEKIINEPKAKENEDSTNTTKKKTSSSTPDNVEEKKMEKVVESKKTKKSTKSKKSQRGTKRDRSNDSSERNKKRKRLLVVDSETSEESGAASEDEDIFESPPPEPPRKVRSPTPPSNGKKRKVRKMVDNTFLDEDGYLVTRKEFVYESCSEPEEAEVPEAKKEAETEKPKGPKINGKKKQTSLMSFFKKG